MFVYFHTVVWKCDPPFHKHCFIRWDEKTRKPLYHTLRFNERKREKKRKIETKKARLWKWNRHHRVRPRSKTNLNWLFLREFEPDQWIDIERMVAILQFLFHDENCFIQYFRDDFSCNSHHSLSEMFRFFFSWNTAHANLIPPKTIRFLWNIYTKQIRTT